MAGKRKKGEGTVRLHKDGRWEGRVVVGYVETLLCGKYFQKSRHKVQVGLSLWVERIVHLFVRPTERVAFGEERAISAAQA